MAKKVAEGVALGLQYEIYDRTGVVTHTETRSETEVEGSISGGGGYSSGGTGYQAPVSGSIASKTTRFQNIFLSDGEGKEHTIELQNFLIPCKPDHKLTMFLLTSGGKDTGSYFSAYNHNTRETYDHPKAIRSEMFPTRSFTILLVISFVLLFITMIGEPDSSFLGTLFLSALGTGLIGIPGWLIGATVGFYRSMLVRKDLAYKNYVTTVGAV